MAELVSAMVAYRLADPESLQGCSEAEIAEVAASQGFKPAELPEAYRAFLRAMGRHAGFLGEDSRLEYPWILEVRAVFEEPETCPDAIPRGWDLPARSFLFYVH